jgi:hypothetical protein
VPPTYEAFKKLLRRFEGAMIRIAYEAGQAGFDLYDKLTDDGMKCIVTPPSFHVITWVEDTRVHLLNHSQILNTSRGRCNFFRLRHTVE